jgi:DNA modification methylase
MPQDINFIIKELQKRSWKKFPYIKQNWGNWFHSISSYVGRIKPSFAHWLIKITSKKKELILDPFCGVGTILLESDLLGRDSIGVDLSPYAIKITKAKFDRKGLENELNFLSKIKFNYKCSLEKVPSFVKEFYHPKTLKEILELIKILKKNKRDFLMGCLLGICHGHRPQHLSMRTGYIIPYIPKPKPEIIYKEVMPRMIQKIKRMYQDYVPVSSENKIILNNILKTSIDKNSIDLIISSPPYYNTIDYVHSNRLRLWFSGSSFKNQENLSKKIIQNKISYEDDMLKVGLSLYRVLKKNGLLIFILGDVHTSKSKTINTAERICSLYSGIGFKKEFIFSDKIPPARTTIVKFKGQQAINNKKIKYDRILVMSK